MPIEVTTGTMPAPIADLPVTYQRMLAAHAALHRLGFEDVFARFQRTDDPVVDPDTKGYIHGYAQIEQAGRVFRVDCGAVAPPEDTHEATRSQWVTAIRAWNALAQSARDQVFRAYYSADLFLLMKMAIEAKGLICPAAGGS